MKYIFALLTLSILAGCSSTDETAKKETEPKTTENIDAAEIKAGNYEAWYASEAPTIDGLGNEICWEKASWAPLDQRWLGEEYDSTDFAGRYKIVWDKNYLYFLVEVIDDSLVDTHDDPLSSYWNDDCVEIFLDENNSDENHQYNYKAFAYHVGLDYQVVDIGPDSVPHFYNDHVDSKRTANGKKYTWEHRIKVFDDSFEYGGDNSPVKLEAGKVMGYALAYCDNDTSEERENFIGSIFVDGEDKDQGWIDEGIFGDLTLKKE